MAEHTLAVFPGQRPSSRPHVEQSPHLSSLTRSESAMALARQHTLEAIETLVWVMRGGEVESMVIDPKTGLPLMRRAKDEFGNDIPDAPLEPVITRKLTASASDRMNAAATILERGFGRPGQSIEDPDSKTGGDTVYISGPRALYEALSRMPDPDDVEAELDRKFAEKERARAEAKKAKKQTGDG